LTGARVSASGRRERWEGQIGGEIPSAYGNRGVEILRLGSFPKLVLFRSVPPPPRLFSLEWWGHFLIWGV
jgi:hypothetical protein